MYCRTCGTQLDQGGYCSKCGQTRSAGIAAPPPPTKRKPKIVIYVLAGILVLFIVGALTNKGGRSSQSPSAAVSSPSAALREPDLAVIDWKWSRGEYGSLYIVGTVKSNSGKRFSYASVEFNLYDASGAQVGNAMDNVNNLEPHGTWKFKAVVIDAENVKSARLKDVSGF